jgi:glycosyltransferase involved in cell wall biosynthesis
VVDVARRATRVDAVIVVDNASADRTGAVARERGARVVDCPTKGKGQAMAAGVAATDADLIVFLDADLLNLTSEHVDSLVAPVESGEVAMSLGLFDRGDELNAVFLNILPKLTGQRAMRRDLFEQLSPEDIRGYMVEAALNSLCNEHDLPTAAFVCEGLWHRTKEEKDEVSPAVGTVRKVGMLTTAVWSYVSYALVRPVRDKLGVGGA